MYAGCRLIWVVPVWAMRAVNTCSGGPPPILSSMSRIDTMFDRLDCAGYAGFVHCNVQNIRVQ